MATTPNTRALDYLAQNLAQANTDLRECLDICATDPFYAAERAGMLADAGVRIRLLNDAQASFETDDFLAFAERELYTALRMDVENSTCPFHRAASQQRINTHKRFCRCTLRTLLNLFDSEWADKYSKLVTLLSVLR